MGVIRHTVRKKEQWQTSCLKNRNYSCNNEKKNGNICHTFIHELENSVTKKDRSKRQWSLRHWPHSFKSCRQ